MPNCAACQRFIARAMLTAGELSEPVCSPECAMVVIDDEADNSARFAVDEIVGSNLNARIER